MPEPHETTSSAGPRTDPLRTTSRRPIELEAYRLLTWLARPAAPLLLKLRERRGKEDRTRLRERVGRSNQARPGGALAWVHAASVGEVNSILPLVVALTEKQSELSVLLTTGTVTSARSVASRLPARTIHQYIPLDAPQLVGCFLDHWRPDLAVLTEQEIWPNLIIESAARGIPLALVNGRMSATSFERWQKRPRVARALFGGLQVVLAQSEAFADRFRALGATGARQVGNLKVDAAPPPVDVVALQQLEAALAGRPRLIAASTHQGEELTLAAAHRELARRHPGFCTIIAPRHPERGPSLAERLKVEGFIVAQRGLGELPKARTDIYLADTIGELGTLYRASGIAFIGGSLIPHGGQNPIEAIRHDTAVLTGPSIANFEDVYQALIAHGGAGEVGTAEDIVMRVSSLLADPSLLDLMRSNGRAALDELSGALERTVAALLPLLSHADGASPNAVGNGAIAGAP